MFKCSRYITEGIQTRIPEYMQQLLWYMISTMEVAGKDHLQVFELSSVIKEGMLKQRILHKQEQPYYSKEHIITVNRPISAKVYVIDDTTHCTMLLAGEY